MANALNRHIEEGESIVIKKSVVLPDFQSLEWRKVKVLGGFGCETFTAGTGLTVEVKDGDIARLDAEQDIDVAATAALTEVKP